MTIVKWKKPLHNGHKDSPLIYNPPLSGFIENFFGDSIFGKEHGEFIPAANLKDEEHRYTIDLSVPGFEKNDFKIELSDKILSVSAKHQSEKETKEKDYTRKEYNYGSFQRMFALPEEIKEEAIEAKYENGILKLSLPKKEGKRKTHKEIKIA
ncbi:MAG TPA: Hsp20/alpha crystallin family protein [Nitrosopumilaceae archaeon]|jgi:HSP20 family protein|nr:Hsp20/alpha crystallin family protein [Nitrosopumilaceae archaeon]